MLPNHVHIPLLYVLTIIQDLQRPDAQAGVQAPLSCEPLSRFSPHLYE